MFGLLAFKPQFGLLVPVALAAGGCWRSLGVATAAVAILILVTLALFGVSVWTGFLHGTVLTRAILDQELVPYYKMQSVFAGCRLIGLSLPVAYGLQLIGSISAALCVAWVWRCGKKQALKNAALVAAVPLASPFFLDYDLLILAPAIAWIAGAMQETGAHPWEKSITTAAFMAPLVARPLGEFAHFPVTSATIIALLVIILARVGADRRVTTPPAGTT